LVQDMIAEAWMSIQQLRLFVLQTAWKIDKYNDYKKVRKDIAAAKILASRSLVDVATKALQIHGSLGISDEMPFVSMIVNGLHVGLADGPNEIHKVTVARELLRDVAAHDGTFPSQHIPALVEQARAKYAETLARHGR
jgi:acyl-CoA dehydrogenase